MKKVIIVVLTLITAISLFQASFAQEIKKRTTVLKRTAGKATPRTKVAPQRRVAAPRRSSPSVLKRTSTRSTVQPTSRLKKTTAGRKIVTPSRKPAPKIESCPITPETIEVRADITKIGDEFGKTVDEETYKIFEKKLETRSQEIYKLAIQLDSLKNKTLKSLKKAFLSDYDYKKFLHNRLLDIKSNALNEIKNLIMTGESSDEALSDIVSKAYTAMKDATDVPEKIDRIIAQKEGIEAKYQKDETVRILKDILQEIKNSFNKQKRYVEIGYLQNSIKEFEDIIKKLESATSTEEIAVARKAAAEETLALLFATNYINEEINFLKLYAFGVSSIFVTLGNLQRYPLFTIPAAIASTAYFTCLASQDPDPDECLKKMSLIHLNTIKDFAQLGGTCVKSTITSGVRGGCNYASGLFNWAKGKCISAQGFANAIFSRKPTPKASETKTK